MKLVLVNNSKMPMPKKTLELIGKYIGICLKKKRVGRKTQLQSELTLVFLDPGPAKKINQAFRRRNYATDILSFAGEGKNLGELIICPQVIKKQAKEHDLTFDQELAYMFLHGVLHLLGYDHEKSKSEAKKMLKIQDEVFEMILQKM
jgi:probable rRNA maturation factor